MEVRAVTKFIRISARKTRLVADLVRGKKALYALSLLQAVNKRAAKFIAGTLTSAISNAKQKEMDEESLWIKKIFVDGGPMFKRFMPRAMGRATMIQHTTSHITILLSDEKPGSKGVEKAEEVEEKPEAQEGKAKDVKKVKVKEKRAVKAKETQKSVKKQAVKKKK